MSPSLLLDLMLEFRPGARGSCRISMALGMLPATFFGEIEVIDEMGICRYSQAQPITTYHITSYHVRTESVPWFLARPIMILGMLTLVTIPTILALK